MSNNLNENLYSRFGLGLEIERVQTGFRKYIKNLLLENLDSIINPDNYQQEKELSEIQDEVLRECCRQTFQDYDDYDASYGMEKFIKEKYGTVDDDSEEEVSFEEHLIQLQALLNVVYKHKFIRPELEIIAAEIYSYFRDYPILNLSLKIYKTQAPQILPTFSKFLDKEIEDILGLLEAKQHKDILENFEMGLKLFLRAKTSAQFKDVIEDMLSACDEVVKVVTSDKNKGLKHIFKKDEYQKSGLNSYQKEIFRNLRDWMDKIKHGTIKDFTRDDVQMVISLVVNFIRFVLNKHDTKS